MSQFDFTLQMFQSFIADKMSRKSRKRKSDGEEQTTVDGEQDNFFSDEIRDEMETMWEVIERFGSLQWIFVTYELFHMI